MQKITEELLDRFLNGLCTKEESAAVMEYLARQPEDEQLADEFRLADAESALPQGYSEEMLGFILAETEGQKEYGPVPVAGEEDAISGAGLVIRPLRRWAAAAAAAMILGLCAIYLVKTGGKSVKRKAPDSQLAAVEWVDQFNHGKKSLEMTLPDGTKIRLMPNSGIRYRKEFVSYGKREVVLTGVARFEVAKNEHLPFVVSSEGLNTCVLGTIFEVTALPLSGSIRVKLIEGKVMLSLDQLVAGNERKEYYMQPGQEFVFDKASHSVAISSITRHRNEIAAEEPHGEVARPDSLANWYMFNNQSLAEVFDQLSMIYNVKIQYSRKDISKLYFIGRLEKKDSLHKIIQDISVLNHLTVTNQNGSYIITKTKP